ncbi:hypothetical protein LXL04_028385 [Taraxacum kok-saghyz]
MKVVAFAQSGEGGGIAVACLGIFSKQWHKEVPGERLLPCNQWNMASIVGEDITDGLRCYRVVEIEKQMLKYGRILTNMNSDDPKEKRKQRKLHLDNKNSNIMYTMGFSRNNI